MKEFVKKVLKSSALGKLIYEPLHQLYRLYSVPHRCRLLHKYGGEVLAELARQFKKHGIPGYATYGTLLGFIRDQGFIPHDDDIDVAILPTGEWSPVKVLKAFLSEPGFSYVFGFTYEDKLVEFKLMFHSVPVDFYFPDKVDGRFHSHDFYYFPNVQYPSDKCNTAKLLNEPCVNKLKSCRVFGVNFPVPENAEEVLQGMYGEGWRIPDAKWSGSSVPNVITLPDFGILVSKEIALNSKG